MIGRATSSKQPRLRLRPQTELCPELAAMLSNPSPAVDIMLSRVGDYFARFGWLARGASVLVGLSGGPDSVALLTVLLLLSRRRRWQIGAAHVNYGLRGEDSAQDEEFCRDLADRLGVALHLRRRRPPKQEKGFNLQMWARQERYRFFDLVAARHGYDWIAVGHNLDDRAESVAAAVLDAAGTFALSGIPPIRGRIIRPLYGCSREIILSFLQAHRIDFRKDVSNQSLKYQRNRIRHQILPAWRANNPSIVDGLSRLGEQLWRQQDYLQREAERCLNAATLDVTARRIVLDASCLVRYDPALDPFVLRSLIRRVGLSMTPSPATVDRFMELRRAKGSARVEQGDLIIEQSKQRLVIARRQERKARAVQAVPVAPGATHAYGPWQVKITIVKEAGTPPFDDSHMVFFDLRKVRTPLLLRPPAAGDRYRPLGLCGHKKLADLLADRGVPASLRAEVPVLADAKGILWPIGHPIADRAKVTPNTRSALRVVATQI